MTLAAAWLLAATTLGCGSSTTSTPATNAEPATFTDIYAMLYPTSTNARCNFCHGLPANEVSNGNLTMGTDKAAAYAALVGKSSTSKDCGGKPLFVAGDPDGSLFVQKFSENAPCGSRMPLGGALLNEEQLTMVRSWVAAGAKDD